MPVYAALTHNGNPPQMEFVPYQSNLKHSKIAGDAKVFKFADMALLTEAKQFAHNDRGLGLWRITRKDTTEGAISQAPFCETIQAFKESLNITSWCNACALFTYGVMSKRTCRKCKHPTQ